MYETRFISRKLEVHPSSVPTRASEWHRSLPSVRAVPGFVRTGARLWLDREPRFGSPDPLQMYVVPGILWLKVIPIQVHLEISMWSETVSQLSLRPARLTWPVRSGGYALQAAAVLDELGAVLAAPLLWRRERIEERVAMSSASTSMKTVARVG